MVFPACLMVFLAFGHSGWLAGSRLDQLLYPVAADDRDHQRGELRLAVMTRSLLPDLVGHRVGAVREPGRGLGQHQRGALSIGEVRRFAPRRDGEDPRIRLAGVLELAGVMPMRCSLSVSPPFLSVRFEYPGRGDSHQTGI
jgi:hypothetical protein